MGIVNYDDAQLKIKDWIRDMIRPNALEFVDIVLEQINEKYVIKIDIKSGDRKPYYLASKGRIPDGCFIRTANGVESMDEDMIEHAMMNSYGPKRRELKDIPSLNTDLTFEILKTKLISKGIHINEKTFLKNYNLITEDGRFNKLADLLADENRVGLAVCVFKGKNKVKYLKRNEYGNVSLVYS